MLSTRAGRVSLCHSSVVTQSAILVGFSSQSGYQVASRLCEEAPLFEGTCVDRLTSERQLSIPRAYVPLVVPEPEQAPKGRCGRSHPITRTLDVSRRSRSVRC